MTTNTRPKLEVPAASSMAELAWVQVEFMFDSPFKLDNTGKDYDSWMYTVLHEGEEHVMFAYTGMYNAITKAIGEDNQAGKIVEIARFGKGQSTTWECRLVGENPNTAARPKPQEQAARPAQTYGNTPAYEPLSAQDKATILWIADEQMNLVLDCIRVAAQKAEELDTGFDGDQVFRLGMSGYINATRTFRSGMTVGDAPLTPPTDHNDAFVAAVKAADEVLGGIVNGLVMLTDAKDREDAIGLIKHMGFRSDRDIDPEDEGTWLRIYHTVLAYQRALLTHDDKEALAIVRAEFDIPETEEAPF